MVTLVRLDGPRDNARPLVVQFTEIGCYLYHFALGFPKSLVQSSGCFTEAEAAAVQSGSLS